MRRFENLLCAGAFLLVMAGLACPRPVPPPNGPGGAGGSVAAGGARGDAGVMQPPEGPAPLGNQTVCKNTCAHAVKICPSVVSAICSSTCQRIGGADPGYIVRLNAATGCDDVTAADKPPATGTGPIQHGR